MKVTHVQHNDSHRQGVCCTRETRYVQQGRQIARGPPYLALDRSHNVSYAKLPRDQREQTLREAYTIQIRHLNSSLSHGIFDDIYCPFTMVHSSVARKEPLAWWGNVSVSDVAQNIC
jgi:hypothetical protein